MTEKSDEPITIQPKKTEKKLSVGQISKFTALAMVGRPPKDWPAFPDRYVVAADDKGERITLTESGNVLRPISDTAVNASILAYLADTIPFKKGWQFNTYPTFNTIADVRRWWAHYAKPVPLDEIQPVTFATDMALTYHRIHFDPVPISPSFDLRAACPCVGEFMSRTSNSRAFMTWIGSIFDQAAYRQQYVWLHGEGNDGKGTLMNKLRALLGASFASEQPPGDNRFWTGGLVGKRLVAFPDVGNVDFVTSGLFKSLTGGDPVRVEFKRGAIVTVDLNILYMILSNKKPGVTDNKADLRRIILCHSRPPTEHFENYESRMTSEMPLFISYCWHLYQRHVKISPNLPIGTEEDEVKELARQNVEDVSTIVDHHFAATGEGNCVRATRIEEVIRHYWKNDRQAALRAREHLRKEYGAKSQPRKIGRESVRLWLGVWERSPLSGWID